MKYILSFIVLATFIFACGSAGDNAGTSKKTSQSTSEAVAKKAVDGGKNLQTVLYRLSWIVWRYGC
jgi:hypothetical protein